MKTTAHHKGGNKLKAYHIISFYELLFACLLTSLGVACNRPIVCRAFIERLKSKEVFSITIIYHLVDIKSLFSFIIFKLFFPSFFSLSACTRILLPHDKSHLSATPAEVNMCDSLLALRARCYSSIQD